MATTNHGGGSGRLEVKVGFLGGGKMAQAIGKGIVAANILNASNIMASARTDETLSVWKVSCCTMVL